MSTRTTYGFGIVAALTIVVAACGGKQDSGSATEEAATTQPMTAESGDEMAAEEEAPTATIRFVHAAPAAPAVDFSAGEMTIAENVGPGTYTRSRAEVPAGEHTIAISPAGTTDAELNKTITLEEGGNYTLVVLGDPTAGVRANQLDAVLLTDNLAAPAAGQSHVRFVHAVPGGPTVMAQSEGGQGYATGLAYKGVSPFRPGPNAATTILLKESGAEEPVASGSVTFAAGRLFTVIAHPADDGVGFLVVNERPAAAE